MTVPEMLRPVIERNIKESGQHLLGVFPTTERPGQQFVYTIGNALQGLPELILVGDFDTRVVGMCLNTLGDTMRKQGKAFDEGLLDIGWNFPFKIRNCSFLVKTTHTIQAGQYIGHELYEVQQVMLCDKEGKYPRDPGVNPTFDVPFV